MCAGTKGTGGESGQLQPWQGPEGSAGWDVSRGELASEHGIHFPSPLVLDVIALISLECRRGHFPRTSVHTRILSAPTVFFFFFFFFFEDFFVLRQRRRRPNDGANVPRLREVFTGYAATTVLGSAKASRM